ncbi:MAG TPA: histidine ammonia-lyase [Chthoniobacterales bacterium]
MDISGRPISLLELSAVASGSERVTLTSAARERIRVSREVVERILQKGEIVYGISTGFGKLSDVKIAPDALRQLQLNLVRSHACGIGQPLSIPEVRAMISLRANVLALGFSGVRLEVVQFLCEMLNRGIHPVVPEKGSVGASGDLAPLAHLALTMIGEGEAFFDNDRLPSADALSRAGVQPLVLEAKDGLALLNGTQAMHAVGGLALLRAKRLAHVADLAGAMTLEALMGTPRAFDPRIQNARPHRGQMAVAEHLRTLLRGSEIRESHRQNDPRVQDAYSTRCIPQVHGAVRDAFAHVEQVLAIESAGATDNPLVFPEQGDVISGGNFHGAPLALALDYAAIALTDLISISERRIESMVNPDLSYGLPAFLARTPGLQSGMMIAQVAAASLLNEARVLAHPASTDSIPTSAGKEDHVSMGMTSALKFRSIVDNAETLLAIELLVAAEALEHRRPLKSSASIERAYAIVRNYAAPLVNDRSLAHEIREIASGLRTGEFDTGHESL